MSFKQNVLNELGKIQDEWSMQESAVIALGELGKIIKSLPEEEPRWIPVSERLPIERKDVLTYGNGFFSIRYRENGKWTSFSDIEVTKWKELVQPIE